MTHNTKILVLGLGNEILGDDMLGIEVVNQLKQRKKHTENIKFMTAAIAGLDFVEEFLDYKVVIVVDSWITDRKEKTIRRLNIEDLENTISFSSPHHLNFATAINLGNKLFPERMPEKIIMFIGEINPVEDFSETISEEAAVKIPHLISLVEKEISKILEEID